MANTVDVIVATWLSGYANQKPATEYLPIGQMPAGREVDFSIDRRVPVESSKRQRGGEYYSIVKLQIRYEKQASDDTRYAQGTGWLIKPDLLVTAGHCVLDHTYKFGKAIEVKAYVGYDGKASVGTEHVQFRTGVKIATTSDWLQNDLHREGDVGFIQLNRPFDNIMPFRFQPTPIRGDLNLEVVGYPMDKFFDDEKGAQMYIMSKQALFDLDKTTSNMLEYPIFTYSGQSGSPVLIQENHAAIGVHVLPGVSSATVIRGKYGNYYSACIDTFTQKFPSTEADGVTYVTVTVDKRETDLTDVPPKGEEIFFSALKSVLKTTAKIESQVLQAGSPFVGPVGGPIAVLAGTALGFASILAKFNWGGHLDPSMTITYNGQCCRAILGEAALQMVLKMDSTKAKQFKVYENMKNAFLKDQKSVPTVARVVGPTLLESAVRIAVLNTSPAAVVATESTFPAVEYSPPHESDTDSESTKFAQAIKGVVKRDGEQKDFLDFLDLVVSAVTFRPTSINFFAKAIEQGGESSSVGPKDGLQPHYESVCYRAVLGDAALQALIKINPDDLQQDGFLDDMFGTIKKIGSTVVNAAPIIRKNITPIAQAVVNKSDESGAGTDTGTGTGNSDTKKGKAPSKSLEDMLNDSNQIKI